jgi:hemerythrin superfamily protein
MDGIEMLEEDHRRVKKLFDEFEGAGDRAFKTKRDIVDRIIEELTVHSEMEEQVLYPAARDEVQSAEEVLLESFEEHAVVENLMEELKGMDPEDETFEAKTTVLIENVRHHIEEEEGELFPKIRQSLGDDRVEELGQQMEGIKQRYQA